MSVFLYIYVRDNSGVKYGRLTVTWAYGKFVEAELLSCVLGIVAKK